MKSKESPDMPDTPDTVQESEVGPNGMDGSASTQADTAASGVAGEPGSGPAVEPGAAAVPGELAALGTALDDTRKELAQALERHLRLAAEYDNYRKRTEREKVEAWSRAQADVVSRLLDVMDDLERVAHFDEGTASAALQEGVQLVDRKLRQVLEAAGLEVVQAEGAVFDPNTMEGLATVEAESPEEDDRVSDVFQKGYVFKGQLLRPARVRVKQYEG